MHAGTSHPLAKAFCQRRLLCTIRCVAIVEQDLKADGYRRPDWQCCLTKAPKPVPVCRPSHQCRHCSCCSGPAHITTALLLLQEWAVKLVQQALEEARVTPEQINVIAYTKVG